MITFKLIEDGVFAAYENGEIQGKAFFGVDGLFCDVRKVEYPADRLYNFQGLMRSVYNYGAGQNAYIGRLSDKNCFDAAKTMNFICDGNICSNDIPTLLMGTCCEEENTFEI